MIEQLDSCPEFARPTNPILARAIDVSSRPDWRQLRHDVELVRSGYVDVDVNGFAA
jgi:hypothetical protein